MHRGWLFRIILVILILGIGTFLIVRNTVLKKKLAQGEIAEITPKDFLPFGNSGGEGGFQELINIITGRGDTLVTPPKKHITAIAENVAGMRLILIEDEIAGPTSTDNTGKNVYDRILALRYVAQENGYVYDYVPKYGKSYLRSDTPIPRVSFAHISPNGNQILFQYLAGDLTTEKSVLGTLGSPDVILLPDNMPSFAFSKNGQFAYIRKNSTGSTIVVRSIDGKEAAVYASPLTEWNLAFINEDSLLLTTKASERSAGFAYILTLSNKSLSRLWSGINGLTTKVSPNGGYILRAETVSSGPELSLYNTRTKTIKKVGKMGMVEKCAFREDDTAFACALPRSFESRLYPDSWYLGEVSTNDEIAIYTTENLNERIYDSLFAGVGQTVDVWTLSTSASGNITAFLNKNDMSLWLYEE